MKVVFYGEDFKKAVDRVLVAVGKNVALSILYCVRVEAKDNQLKVSTTDTESFAEVVIDATVMEPGVSYIMDDDIKKIYTLADYVTLTTNADKLIVSNSKKKSSVPLRTYTDEEFVFPENPDKKYIETTERNLLVAMSDLAPYLSCEIANKAMIGYSFDGAKNRMVALDGHRIGVKKLDDFYVSQDSVIVIGKAYTHLKKIASAKSDNTVTAYVNDKYIKFVGYDFTYSVRLIDAVYFDVDRLLDSSYDTEFTLPTKEMGALAKEYKKVAKDKIPMFMYYNHEEKKMSTGIVAADYITSDIIEDFTSDRGFSRDMMYAFNPVFIADAMQLFGDDVTCKCTVTGQIQKSPMMFEDDTYKVLVLPVNAVPEHVQTFKQFVA